MTTLARWDPFRALRRREDAFDELFREFFARGESETIEPSADVVESDGEVTVRMAIPGVDREHVQISVENGVLDVHGETRKESKEEKKNYYRQEIRSGAFRRMLTLPADVDVDKADARLKDGMLTITMPKSTAAKGHEIKVAA